MDSTTIGGNTKNHQGQVQGKGKGKGKGRNHAKDKGKGKGRSHDNDKGKGKGKGKGNGKGKGKGKDKSDNNNMDINKKNRHVSSGHENAEPDHVVEAATLTFDHPIADIGVNLAHRSFGSHWREVADRALAVGVDTLIVTGTNLPCSTKASQLAEQASNPADQEKNKNMNENKTKNKNHRRSSAQILFTAGVHPHNAKSCDADPTVIDKIESIAVKCGPLCAAIGECGLDYDRNFSTPQSQRRWFEAQLRLAAKLKKPVFLHERDAHDDFVKIWRSVEGSLGEGETMPRGVVHCFTGTPEQLRVYLEMGFFIGLTGFICNTKRAMHLQDAIREIPLDRLMVETDAPFMRPANAPKGRGSRARECEPAHLPYVVLKIAELTGKDVNVVARETYRTTMKFFAPDDQWELVD